ncbi:MAG: DUF1565 domain-containing protein [Planctomycetota bacterium]
MTSKSSRVFAPLLGLVRGAATSALLITTLTAGVTTAEDLYVRAGAEKGKGTRERPYRALYKALERAKPGDVIHVAEGDYSGKLDVGFVTIGTRNLTLLGGYAADYSERNPYRYPSRLHRRIGTDVEAFDNGLVLCDGDVSGLVIDGFVFDSTGRNVYRETGELDVTLSLTKPPITLAHADSHLRNSIFLNTAGPAVRISGPSSSIENCLIVNAVQFGIEIHGRHAAAALATDTQVLIRNNTILFTWQWRETGGSAIQIGSYCKVRLENNLIGFHQGVAISNIRNFDGKALHQMIGNVFFLNRAGNYEFFSRQHNQNLVVDDPADLEEADLAQAEGNLEIDPLFRLPASWVEQYLDVLGHEDAGLLSEEELATLRRRLGLPLEQPTRRGTYAPPYPLAAVLNGALWQTGGGSLEGIGVQVASLLPIVLPPSEERVAEESDWARLFEGGEQLVERRIRILARCKGEISASSGAQELPRFESIDSKTHRLIELGSVGGESSLLASVRRDSGAGQFLEEEVLARGPEGGELLTFEGVLRRVGEGPEAGRLILEIESLTR